MIQKVLNILKVVAFSLLVADLEAQDTVFVKKLALQKHQLNNRGMVFLTSWASVNIASGTAVLITHSYEEKCFYAMNSGWGLVNLVIAVPSLVAKPKTYPNTQQLSTDLKRTEKIFLINAGLDVVYIGAGIGSMEFAKTRQNIKEKEMYRGFGKSFVLQGSALLFFDGLMYQMNKKLRKKVTMTHQQVAFFVTPARLHLIYRF